MSGVHFTLSEKISSRDVDGFARCRPSALLCHLQEAATLAAEHGNFGRSLVYDQYGAFWMLARMWYRLERPLMMGEDLRIETWHRGGKGATMYRDYNLFIGDTWVGEGVAAWVLASLDNHKLLRLSSIPELANTDGGEKNKTITLSKLRIPETLTYIESRPMRYSDTDINGHVNNTRYADFVCDVLQAQCLQADMFLQEMQLGYLAECKPGDVLRLSTAFEQDAYFVHAADEQDVSRFDGMAKFAAL